MTAPIVPMVIQQHAEEAAVQWLLRDSAIRAPHYNLEDLAKLDGRVEAHLDGLRIAGDDGWAIVEEELAWEEAGEVFTAGALGFSTGADERIAQALEAASQSVEVARGFVSALAWLETVETGAGIAAMLDDVLSLRRYIAVASLAGMRRRPDEERLRALLGDDDFFVRARALRAVGELGWSQLGRELSASLDAGGEVGFWCAWSAALLGTTGADVRLRAIVEGEPENNCAETAVDLAARIVEPSEAQAWIQSLRERSLSRLAVRAAGAAGDPVPVPWLIESAEDDQIARPAGEAISMITGVDLAYDDLERDWPEGFEAGPTEDPGDENVEMDADEDLPWPDPELVSRWWHDHQGQFQSGTRYLLGKPITEPNLQEALRFGKQRQRAAAALELALLAPGTPLFEVRARGDRQMQQLGITPGDFRARESMR